MIWKRILFCEINLNETWVLPGLFVDIYDYLKFQNFQRKLGLNCISPTLDIGVSDHPPLGMPWRTVIACLMSPFLLFFLELDRRCLHFVIRNNLFFFSAEGHSDKTVTVDHKHTMLVY